MANYGVVTVPRAVLFGSGFGLSSLYAFRHGDGVLKVLTPTVEETSRGFAGLFSPRSATGAVTQPIDMYYRIVLVGGTIATGMVLSYVYSNFSDLIYVTRGHFNASIAFVKEGVIELAVSLANFRDEVYDKLGLLETQLDDTKNELTQTINDEVTRVNDNVELVGSVVKTISDRQNESQYMIKEVDSKLTGIESQLERSQKQLNSVSRGVHLLCHSVRDILSADGANTTPVIDQLVSYTNTIIDPEPLPQKHVPEPSFSKNLNKILSGSRAWTPAPRPNTNMDRTPVNSE